VLRVWWALAASTIGLTLVTFHVQPQVPNRLLAQPWGAVFPALAVAGLFGIRWFMVRRAEVRSFLASCAYIAGMLTSAVFGLYPYVLPASTDPSFSLTVHNAKAPDYGLKIGLVWWVLGMLLASIYFVFTYRQFAGKIQIDSEGHY